MEPGGQQPVVHPLNRRTWRAFHLVQGSRVIGFGALGGFDWTAVALRLMVHDLWAPDVERGLAVCEAALLEVEAEVRDGERPQAEHRR